MFRRKITCLKDAYEKADVQEDCGDLSLRAKSNFRVRILESKPSDSLQYMNFVAECVDKCGTRATTTNLPYAFQITKTYDIQGMAGLDHHGNFFINTISSRRFD